MKVLLYLGQHGGIEVTQEELDEAIRQAEACLPEDSTLVAAVTGEILRGMFVGGRLSPAAYRGERHAY